MRSEKIVRVIVLIVALVLFAAVRRAVADCAADYKHETRLLQAEVRYYNAGDAATRKRRLETVKELWDGWGDFGAVPGSTEYDDKPDAQFSWAQLPHRPLGVSASSAYECDTSTGNRTVMAQAIGLHLSEEETGGLVIVPTFPQFFYATLGGFAIRRSHADDLTQFRDIPGFDERFFERLVRSDYEMALTSHIRIWYPDSVNAVVEEDEKAFLNYWMPDVDVK